MLMRIESYQLERNSISQDIKNKNEQMGKYQKTRIKTIVEWLQYTKYSAQFYVKYFVKVY